MQDNIKERISDFFRLDLKELEEKCATKDLYSAVSELTGIDRDSVKNLSHGFAYGVGKEVFKNVL